jgi:hypothetical protein
MYIYRTETFVVTGQELFFLVSLLSFYDITFFVQDVSFDEIA